MGIKEFFGFGDKKRDRDYSFPADGYYGDPYYGEGYVQPHQYYQESNPPKPAGNSNSMPPLNFSRFDVPKCTVEKMSIEKLLGILQDSKLPTPVETMGSNVKANDSITNKASTESVEAKTSKTDNTSVKVETEVKNADAGTLAPKGPEIKDTKVEVGKSNVANDKKPAKQKPARPGIAQPKDIIVLFVENTPDVLAHKDDVLNILSKILDTQKSALFLLNSLGKTNTFFELLDYEDITADKALTKLLSDENSDEKPKLVDAIEHVNKHLRKKWPRFIFKGLPYMVDSCNIICLGSRDTIDIELRNEDITESISDLVEYAKLNVFKYLCLGKEKEIKIFTLKLPDTKHQRFVPVKPQQKDIIVFIVENTPSVLTQQNSIINIIKQIAANQKSALFLLIKAGRTNEYSKLLDYDTISANNLFANLFDDKVTSSQTDLASAMQYAKDTLSPMIVSRFTFNGHTCVSSSFSFVCIGSGSAFDNESSKKAVASCIKAFTKWSKTRNLKYLCVSDRETIKAAALGFPDVKHIISNFYY